MQRYPADTSTAAGRSTEGEDGDRVVLVAKLPPRYGPKSLLEAITLPGVQEVERDS